MEAARPEVKGKVTLQESGSKLVSVASIQVKKVNNEDQDMIILNPMAFNKGVAAKQKSKFKVHWSESDAHQRFLGLALNTWLDDRPHRFCDTRMEYDRDQQDHHPRLRDHS